MRLIVGFSKPLKWKPFAWLIMKAYAIPYSHVYLRFYSTKFDRVLIYQASHMSVNFMGHELFGQHNSIITEFECNVSDVSYEKMIQFAIDNAGKPYGIKNAIGLGLVRLAKIFFNKDINNPFADGKRTYVCCELVADMLKEYLGINELNNIESISPKDVYELLHRLKNIDF